MPDSHLDWTWRERRRHESELVSRWRTGGELGVRRASEVQEPMVCGELYRGFLATIQALQDAGVWSLVAYTAGVSGSCWALGERCPESSPA